MLVDCVQEGELTECQALEIAENILFNNANELYKLHWKPNRSSNTLASTSLVESDARSRLQAAGVKFVRVVWCDNRSGEGLGARAAPFVIDLFDNHLSQ